MKRLHDVINKLNSILLLGGSVLITSPVHATAHACDIDLVSMIHNCGSVAPISFVSPPAPGVMANETVVKIDLSPSSGYSKAMFKIFYGGQPEGWSVNIGDSSTNNGAAGDGGTQSNDAELDIRTGTDGVTWMNVFGNDYVSPSRKQLVRVQQIVEQGETLILRVENERLFWKYPQNTPIAQGNLNSPHLYALEGQLDDEGTINYDIYAAFNRVITGSRHGSGVTEVRIVLF